MRSRSTWWLLLVACNGSPEPGTSCGAGTMLEGNTCVVAPALPCGSGTHEEMGNCVADPGPQTARYDLRTRSTIRADGFTAIDIAVVGTNADGTSSHEAVVFSIDRASAGTIVSPNVVLGELGGSTTFRPCLAGTIGCTGPVQFSAALASAPQTPVAHVDAMLVAPAPVGSIAPCMTGGNVLHFEAVDFGMATTQTITSNGVFHASGNPQGSAVQVVAGNASFLVVFSAVQLGSPLLATSYENARSRYGEAGPYEPVLDTGYSPCGVVGAFQIHSRTVTADETTEITASFYQYCEFFPPQTQPTKTLTGCVHYSL